MDRETKKLLNQINALAPSCMSRDHHTIYKNIRSIKKQCSGKRPIPEAITKRTTGLLKKVRRSAAEKAGRKAGRPNQLNYPPDLPITGKKNDIIRAIRENPVVIISGETGSGKTTQIPKFCLDAGRGLSGMIGCTQPRRIAAMNVAKRIAFELNEPMGRSVGYKIRFDDKTPANAYIKLMTDGILLAETQQDRFLTQYDTLIVDEAHERSLNIDFTLGILRRLVHKRRDLKLVITSATIDTEKFSNAFDRAPVIEVSGRMFPVETLYRPILGDTGEKQNPEDQGYVEAAADAALTLLNQTRAGDILIFMPTEQDIGETMELIRGRQLPGITVLPLFARLSAKEQAKVFTGAPGRKIIVSTNVAETSLTIPGIKYVIDTGLARIPSYSPRTRTTSLPVKAISQSSANQRQGRCGRVENGVCIRLYDEDDFNGRPFFTAPEILRSNLAEVILRMISLNLGDVSVFPFIDPPAPKSIRDGFDTLVELGAIREKKRRPRGQGSQEKKVYELTPVGRIMARLPVDPKLSRILIEADKNRCLAEAVVIATALSISDVRQRPADKAAAADQQHAQFKDPTSDFVTLLNIWDAYKTAEKKLKSRGKLKRFCVDRYLSFKRIREWQDIHRQIRQQLRDHDFNPDSRFKVPSGTAQLKSKEFELGGPLYIALHKALLSGYLAHIAHKKEKNIYTAAKGQQAVIFPGSGLYDRAGNWIVAAEFVKTSQLFARGVANIDPGWLEEMGGDLCTRTWSDPHWEKKRGQVVAKEHVALFGLPIVNGRSVSYGRVNPNEAGEIFIRQALVQGEVLQKFPFMAHNLALVQEVEELEHKTRKKDILATEEDMFLFYQQRLPKPFSDIRTFARFMRDQGDDAFLRMTLADLQKARVDEAQLSLFPDVLDTAQGNFALSYEFNPGAATDGVTVKVPKANAGLVDRHSLDKLVPGLFEEKIAALIKNLPKQFRKRLVPVQETARTIAREMPKREKPLFTLLSEFIHKEMGLTIPATAWSDEALPDHLRMRISIRDEKDREIKSLRDPALLNQFPAAPAATGTGAFEQACKAHERTAIRDWDFPDLPPHIIVREPNGFSLKVFPALTIEENSLNLRLFKSRDRARASHPKGIRRLYEILRPEDVKALKKDIRTRAGLKMLAPYFNGQPAFMEDIYQSLAAHFFAKDLRSQEEFQAHCAAIRPQLYTATKKILDRILEAGREYETCFTLIQSLSLKYKNRPQASQILAALFTELKNLMPPHFLTLYSLDRVAQLHRYVACLRIRAQRGVDNPAKETQKAELVKGYQRKLTGLLTGLSEKSSPEKAQKVEDFFWLLEEYKISVFAQELKTKVKVSAKRLDKELTDLSTMI